MCLFGHIHATPWIVPDWSHLAFTEECAYLGTPGMMPVTVPIWAQVRDAVGPTTVPKLVNAEDDLERASNYFSFTAVVITSPRGRAVSSVPPGLSVSSAPNR
jgi:hypothetical protein